MGHCKCLGQFGIQSDNVGCGCRAEAVIPNGPTYNNKCYHCSQYQRDRDGHMNHGADSYGRDKSSASVTDLARVSHYRHGCHQRWDDTHAQCSMRQQNNLGKVKHAQGEMFKNQVLMSDTRQPSYWQAYPPSGGCRPVLTALGGKTHGCASAENVAFNPDGLDMKTQVPAQHIPFADQSSQNLYAWPVPHQNIPFHKGLGRPPLSTVQESKSANPFSKIPIQPDLTLTAPADKELEIDPDIDWWQFIDGQNHATTNTGSGFSTQSSQEQLPAITSWSDPPSLSGIAEGPLAFRTSEVPCQPLDGNNVSLEQDNLFDVFDNSALSDLWADQNSFQDCNAVNLPWTDISQPNTTSNLPSATYNSNTPYPPLDDKHNPLEPFQTSSTFQDLSAFPFDPYLTSWNTSNEDIFEPSASEVWTSSRSSLAHPDILSGDSRCQTALPSSSKRIQNRLSKHAKQHPDSQKDQFLIDCKARGMSYKDIKSLGGFEEAESTLRGRYRTLTKPKEERVRKPEWRDHDIQILFEAVSYFTDDHHHHHLQRDHNPSRSQTQDQSPSPTMRSVSDGRLPPHQSDHPHTQYHASSSSSSYHHEAGVSRIPWKQVAEYMAQKGCYRFGNATVKKKYFEVLEADRSAGHMF